VTLYISYNNSTGVNTQKKTDKTNITQKNRSYFDCVHNTKIPIPIKQNKKFFFYKFVARQIIQQIVKKLKKSKTKLSFPYKIFPMVK